MAEKILIVDDDLESLKLIGLMLQRRGYQIMAAQGGAQALSKTEAEQPDLVILDVMMPDMDGYEVTRRMRANTKTAHIPIIMFTAKTLVGDKVAGFQAGADDYLTKPIHPAELASRVEAVLLRSSRTRVDSAARLHARIIGCMGVKGGVGTTTLAINVTVAIAQSSTPETPRRVTLADLHSSAGDVALQLGLTRTGGLLTLLERPAEELTAKLIEPTLVGHVSGARLLLTPAEQRVEAKDIPAPHAEALVRQLAGLSDVVVLDLGSRLDAGVQAALKLCSRVVVALEPQRTAVMLAQTLVAHMENLGVGQDRVVAVVVNRTPSASSLSKGTIEGLLSRDIVVVISPAPEVAFQASEQGAPIIMVQPGNVVSDQFRELARFVMLGPVA
ncbi:MAG TPA: response regulator [Anaerolineae bacterium]|nr:response regulator [Anaerolineae bacterium]